MNYTGKTEITLTELKKKEISNRLVSKNKLNECVNIIYNFLYKDKENYTRIPDCYYNLHKRRETLHFSSNYMLDLYKETNFKIEFYDIYKIPFTFSITKYIGETTICKTMPSYDYLCFFKVDNNTYVLNRDEFISDINDLYARIEFELNMRISKFKVYYIDPAKKTKILLPKDYLRYRNVRKI